MNFANVKGLTIPQGKVTKIELLKDSMRTLLWQAIRYLKGYTIGGNAEVKDGRIVGVGDYDSASGKYSLPIVASNQSGSESTTYPLLVSSPLYKVGSVQDVAKFGEGVTRTLRKVDMGELSWDIRTDISPHMFRSYGVAPNNKIGLCPLATLNKNAYDATLVDGILYWMGSYIMMYNSHYTSGKDFKEYVKGNQLLYELATPTTEAVDLPKIVDYQPTILTTDTEVVGDITIEE